MPIKMLQGDPMTDPFDKKDEEIMSKLSKVLTLSMSMEQTYPNHLSLFMDGIRTCQDVIMHRIVQSDCPWFFPLRGKRHE